MRVRSKRYDIEAIIVIDHPKPTAWSHVAEILNVSVDAGLVEQAMAALAASEYGFVDRP